MNSNPNPTDSDWWWQYGLDGIIGALLGGLVAGLLAARILKRTITHERGLAREVRVMDMAARLRSAALRVLVPMATDNVRGREILPQITDLQAVAFELTGLAARDWSNFSQKIEDLMPKISNAIRSDLVLDTAGMINPAIWDEVVEVTRVCKDFLHDPDSV